MAGDKFQPGAAGGDKFQSPREPVEAFDAERAGLQRWDRRSPVPLRVVFGTPEMGGFDISLTIPAKHVDAAEALLMPIVEWMVTFHKGGKKE